MTSMVGIAVQDKVKRMNLTNSARRSFVLDTSSGMFMHATESGALQFTVSSHRTAREFEIHLVSSDGNPISRCLFSTYNLTERSGEHSNTIFEFDMSIHTTTQNCKCCFFYVLISWIHTITNAEELRCGVEFSLNQQIFLVGPIFVCWSKYPNRVMEMLRHQPPVVHHNIDCVSFVSTKCYPQDYNTTVKTDDFLRKELMPRNDVIIAFDSYSYAHESVFDNRTSPMKAISALANFTRAIPSQVTLITHIPVLKIKISDTSSNVVVGVSSCHGGVSMLYDKSKVRSLAAKAICATPVKKVYATPAVQNSTTTALTELEMTELPWRPVFVARPLPSFLFQS